MGAINFGPPPGTFGGPTSAAERAALQGEPRAHEMEAKARALAEKIRSEEIAAAEVRGAAAERERIGAELSALFVEWRGNAAAEDPESANRYHDGGVQALRELTRKLCA